MKKLKSTLWHVAYKCQWESVAIGGAQILRPSFVVANLMTENGGEFVASGWFFIFLFHHGVAEGTKGRR